MLYTRDGCTQPVHNIVHQSCLYTCLYTRLYTCLYTCLYTSLYTCLDTSLHIVHMSGYMSVHKLHKFAHMIVVCVWCLLIIIDLECLCIPVLRLTGCAGLFGTPPLLIRTYSTIESNLRQRDWIPESSYLPIPAKLVLCLAETRPSSCYFFFRERDEGHCRNLFTG